MSHVILNRERYSPGPVLRSVRAEGKVTGLLFELLVEQCYVNDGSENIEAVYTFPVPWNAVLLDVELEIGGKLLRGAVVAKADGERIYEGALEGGDSAVMIERAADGMYTASVGNLLPGEQAILRFRHAQLLSFAQGQVRLAVPTVIAPRFGDPGRAGLQPHQAPATGLCAEYPFSLGIELHGDMAAAALSSPSHAIAMRRTADGVTIALGKGARLDRDFVLVADGLSGRSISTLGRDGEGYVALASFCPADEGEPHSAPLQLKILVDCSGSMNGERIAAARRALHEVLGHLEADDSFSYSRFGNTVQHHTASLMAATSRAIRKASQWVAATEADLGGTELANALLSTFALAQPFPADVLLITDGDVWETDKLIAGAEAAGQRVFAVGIGGAPAANLLHALARKTGGACEFVAADTEVEGAIVRMFRRMRQAPVRAVNVAWDGETAWQTSPGKAVLGGETVHHFAGFAQQPPARATLGWRGSGDGAIHQAEVDVDAAVAAGDTLARMAAAARLDEAAPSARHALALQYRLVSATTNLVLVHQRSEAEKPSSMPVLRKVAQMAPAGWAGVGAPLMVSSSGPRQAAVWRRESASDMISAMARSSVEAYDVPSFLRRALDDDDRYLHRATLRRLVEAAAPDGLQSADLATLPASLEKLEGMLPDQFIDELQLLVDAGFPEHEVIYSFIFALAALFRPHGFASRLLNALQWIAPATRRRHVPGLARRAEAVASKAYYARLERPLTPGFLRQAAD